MRAERIKTYITSILVALALACGAWALYVDISSDGKDPTVMRWFGAGMGLIALSWVLTRIAIFNRRRGPRS